MARQVLTSDKVSPEAQKVMDQFHADVVRQVAETVQKEAVVVVGMSQNPFVKKARKALDAQGVSYRYLEYGSYFSHWKERLAIKLWSGWPTYPQVFVQGKLIGGYSDLAALIAQGGLPKR
jgi:glutaredoxin-related protein